jgi:transposase
MDLDMKSIRSEYRLLAPYFDEAMLRLWAAARAAHLPHGGIRSVAAAVGLSRRTVERGLRQLRRSPKARVPYEPESRRRARRPGGGRKMLTIVDPSLLTDLERLVEPTTRGDPESPLRWTCKSTTRLAEELNGPEHRISQRKVCDLLAQLGYSLQSTRKTREGSHHPDRNAQFEHIAATVKRFQKAGQPVISVDTKKKELIGDFAVKGREWRPAGQPELVRVHDFEDRQLGKVTPYGVYDLAANQGWVSVGIDHDTAEFAVETIRRWWREMGRSMYPKARRLLITADAGGSNGSRVRLWKVHLQHLADELSLTITVSHFPPGTSKWNKIEHRMFCHISNNWRGKPLRSRQVVVSLIGNTSTAQGLKIRAALDTNTYPSGQKVSKAEMEGLSLKPHKFHGDWNYTLKPR